MAPEAALEMTSCYATGGGGTTGEVVGNAALEWRHVDDETEGATW